jgi:transcriptional regulator with XRE-family HTH domain
MKKTIHSENGKIIADTVTRIRKSAGFTQRVLAQKLGRERSFIAYCELGERRIDLAEFFWICKACDASPSDEAFKLMSTFENQK